MQVKVRATVNGLGLKPGQEAEIELDDRVVAFLRAGLFQLLRPKNG